MKFCSECGYKVDDTAKFCSNCGVRVKKDIHTNQSSKLSSPTITSPIKSYSKVSSFKDTLTSTASKLGEKLTHSSKSPIGIPLKFNLQNPINQNETEGNVKKQQQPIDPVAKQSEILYKRLEIYRDKLLQIDRRNRSLLLRKIYDKWCFDLGKIINRNHPLGDKLTENAILHKRPLCIIPDSDNSDFANKDRIKLKSLYRNIIHIERDTGRNETYFGFPFLVGHILEKENNIRRYIRGPVILFPINIENRKTGRPPGWYIVFSKERKPILNRALFEGIRKIAGITLHHSFVDEFDTLMESIEEKKNVEIVKSMTIKGEDSINNESDNTTTIDNTFFKELNNLLTKYNFPINLEEKYTTNKFQILETLSYEELSIMEKQNLHLVNFKIIGNFPQGETSIYTDYEQLLKKVKDFGESNLGIIDDLLESPSLDNSVWDEGIGEEHFSEIDLDSIPSKNLNLVIESDASQDSVIIASQSSECTVVRGPPGTGKSQAIVNLISNALANQKKVLVVCQKRAALDVVFQRLDKVHLGKYVALVHDYNKDRSSLYRNLSKILDSDFNSSDTYAISNKFQQISNEIDTITEIQKKIVTSLHKQYFGGISAHTLYTNAKFGYIPKLDLSIFLDKIDYPQLSQLTYLIKTFESDSKKYDINNYPLLNRKSFSLFDYQDKHKIEEKLDTVISLLNSSYNNNNNSLNVKEDYNVNIIFTKDKEEQKILIESLNILVNEKGLFKKLKGNWKLARGKVKKILSLHDNLLEDSRYLQDLIELSTTGLQLWNDIEDNLSSFLNENELNELIKLFNLKRYKTALDRLEKIKDCIDNDFDSLQSYDKRKIELESVNRQILDLFISRLSNENNWEEIIKQEFFYAWINHIEKENPILKSQPFEEYIKNRNRLAQLLKDQREITVRKLIYQLNSNITRPKTFTRNKRNLENKNSILWNKLSDDLNRKRRIPPIRKLIEKYQSIIFKVAPCWLVSPETVSTIFPLQSNLFDLIIFDEASQLAVEKSFPVLYRGGNIVIMGDEKQLRPFDLFKIQDDEDEDEYSNEGEEDEDIINDSVLSESLLVLAKRIYGYRYLTWHYRSQYQELIDFSNKAFYDGNLQVAPNILLSVSHPPIRWINCNNGVWLNRKNFPEATLVVDELKNIMVRNRQNNKKQSIGIITFNDNQKEVILDEIDNRRRLDTEFDQLYSDADNSENNNLDDLPFVTNIENVQGNERNTIIFSVGYAKNIDGRLYARFGSLNQEGGENRLNVAITRAREEIIIVCSFNPNELKIEDSVYEGPKLLKEYLFYAKYISERNNQNAQAVLSRINTDSSRVNIKSAENNILLFDSLFEELVYNRLRDLNYKVDSQVGYSGYKIDLAIVHPDNPNKYILGIECDGASFHSAKSVRERDVMRQEFLEKRGWIIERIWSRTWWRNPDKEIKRIQERIERLRNQEEDTNIESYRYH